MQWYTQEAQSVVPLSLLVVLAASHSGEPPFVYTIIVS